MFGDLLCVGGLMGKCAIVFAGNGGLDQSELREAVLRIPEVSQKLREAQQIMDANSVSLDINNLMMADEESFMRWPQIRALAAALVQIGLFERHRKYQPAAEFLVGSTHQISSLKVITGESSLKEMIETALAELAQPLTTRSLDSQEEIKSFEVVANVKPDESKLRKFEARGQVSADLRSLLASLVEQDGVTQIISIGPINPSLDMDSRSLSLEEVEVLDSIDMDPMLSWFWRRTRPLMSAHA